jgi:hypothetical protein
MSPSLTEGQHAGEFVLSEANGNRARDNVIVTVGAATTFAAGSVLGKITASGKYVLYDDGNADGSEVAAAVLYDNVENSGGAPADFTAVAIVRDAEVRTNDLQWAASVDEAGGIVDLAAVGIIARG